MGRQNRRQQQRRTQQRGRPRARQPARPPTQEPPRRGFGRGTRVLTFVVLGLALGGLGYFLSHPHILARPLPTVLGTDSPSGLPVDGILCQGSESLQYHIHQHLALYDHGKQVPLPSAIGIPGGENPLTESCLYWLHVHGDTANVIHVESPTRRVYTLGNFFDVWRATKDTASPPTDAFVLKAQAAQRAGAVTTFVNGKRWRGSYRTIPLRDHEVIQVDIGKPVVPFQSFTNWGDL